MIKFSSAAWTAILAAGTASGRAAAFAALNPATLEIYDSSDTLIRSVTVGAWTTAANPLGGWNAIPGAYTDDGTGEGAPSYAVWKASGTEVVRMTCSIALEADYKLLKGIEEGVPLRRANFAIRFQTPTQQGTAPVFTAAPTITGTPAVGQTLTAVSGSVTGEPAPELSYQWIANDSEVLVGQTGSTLTLTSAHLGKTIKVRQYASNANGAAESTSTATSAVTEAIPDPLSASFPASISVAQGREYSLARHVTGGTAPLAYTATGLPANVTLNASTGMLTIGGAATIATTSITVTVTDSASGNQGGSISLSVTAAPTITELDALVTVTNRAGSTATNTPVHRVIPFRQGQIPSGKYPVAQIGGVDIAAQQFVIKARHADSSVKHGIFSAIVPSLAASGTADIEWVASDTDPNGSAISKAAVVSALGDTSVTITDSTDPLVTKTWDIGSILNAATIGSDMRQSFEWVNGAQCVCYVLRDRVGTTYDLTGPDGQIVTPMFEVWHWPSLSATLVCFRFEISKVSGWGGWAGYEVDITNAIGSTVYSNVNVSHAAGTAWRKRIWVQGSDPWPDTFDIKMDNEWLSSIGANFRFDPDYTIPYTSPGGSKTSAIEPILTQWASASKDIGGQGLFGYKGMGPAGIRTELGPYPGWDVVGQMTGRADVQKIVIANSDLGCAFTGILIESESPTTEATTSGAARTKRYWFDMDQSVEGKGWPVCTYGRPTLRINEGTAYPEPAGDAADLFTVIGTNINTWTSIAGSHLYNIHTWPFVWSGEFHYLDMMFSWTRLLPHRGGYPYNRAPSEQYRRPSLPIGNGVRAEFRPHLMIWDCAWWSPDGSVLKTASEKLGIDCLLWSEGIREIVRDDNTSHPHWQRADTYYGDLPDEASAAYVSIENRPSKAWKSLKFWGGVYGLANTGGYVINDGSSGFGFWPMAYGAAGYMNAYMKGYSEFRQVLDFVAENFCRFVLDAGANPKSLAAYAVPITSLANKDFYTSVADSMANFNHDQEDTLWPDQADYRPMSWAALGAMGELQVSGYNVADAYSTFSSVNAGYNNQWDICWRIVPRGN